MKEGDWIILAHPRADIHELQDGVYKIRNTSVFDGHQWSLIGGPSVYADEIRLATPEEILEHKLTM